MMTPPISYDLTDQVTDSITASTKTVKAALSPRAWSITALRDCLPCGVTYTCNTSDKPAIYWREQIESATGFCHDQENAVVLLLTCRLNIRGHVLVGLGTLDSVSVHPREVFRPAILASAHSIIFKHNHPSGDPTPSEPDIKMSQALQRAGATLGIELKDSIIIGEKNQSNPFGHVSLRERGYFS